MDDKGFEGINIIPLVDVMLVLLTIVLTTSTFIVTGAIPVQLPTAANGTTEQARAGVLIEIDQNGGIFFDGKESGLEAIRANLSRMDRSRSVLIRADKSIELQVFVRVMDIVKGLRFEKVSLQTEAS